MLSGPLQPAAGDAAPHCRAHHQAQEAAGASAAPRVAEARQHPQSAQPSQRAQLRTTLCATLWAAHSAEHRRRLEEAAAAQHQIASHGGRYGHATSLMQKNLNKDLLSDKNGMKRVWK